MLALSSTALAFANTEGVEVAPYDRGLDCTPSGLLLKLKWNPYPSELGLYEVEGCEGVSPKLHLKAGSTYIWDQSNETNWYHPVGFAYIAGGAHTSCKVPKESQGGYQDGECPELGGEESGSTLSYHVNGEPVTDDESTFGLDTYEPLFFNSQSWWGKQKPFQVALTIPADATYTKIYYFCHIHAHVSAEIEIYGSIASSTTTLAADYLGGMTQASALQVFDEIVATEQQSLSKLDRSCGTWNAAKYADHAICDDKHFLCGAGARDTFGDCLEMIDCQMHNEMAVSVPSTSTSKFATFARQMIAHHQNAVAMAKVLSMHMEPSDFPPSGTEDQDMEWAQGLTQAITSVQNHQIQSMQAWLDANPTLAGVSTLCYDGQ